eukprot:2961101-Pyramimonas_sp.AAC.1
MGNRRRILRHISRKFGAQSYRKKGNDWRHFHYMTFYTAPAHMIADSSVLVTVAKEKRGHLPARGDERDSDITETHHVPLCSTGEDHRMRLGRKWSIYRVLLYCRHVKDSPIRTAT